MAVHLKTPDLLTDSRSDLITDKVLTFVNLSYWAPSIETLLQSEGLASLASNSYSDPTNATSSSFSSLFRFVLEKFKQIGIVINKGVV